MKVTMTMYCNLFADFLKVQSFSVCLCFICFVDSLSIKSQPHTKKNSCDDEVAQFMNNQTKRYETRRDQTRRNALTCESSEKFHINKWTFHFEHKKKSKRKIQKKVSLTRMNWLIDGEKSG